MFNLRQLRSFVHVAQQKSFTKAAKVLYMTQPAISAQIKALEQSLEVQLLERNDRHVVLTEAGKLLLEEAEKILGSYEKILESINELKGLKRGHLKVAASTIPGEYKLPKFIGFFKEKYPKIQIELSITDTEQVIESLKDRTADLGVTGAKIDSDIISYEKLFEDELIIIAPTDSEIANKEKVSWQDLLNQSFILREAGSGTRAVMLEKLKAHQVKLEDIFVAMEIGSTRAVITAVESGLGISMVSKWAAEQALELGLVKKITIEGWNPTRTLFLAWNINKYRNHITHVFAEELKKYSFK